MFNTFFINIVPNLKISYQQDFLCKTKKIENPLIKAIEKYKNHPSIINIKTNIKSGNSFNIQHVTVEKVEKIIRNLDIKKAKQETDIPTKILKQNSDIFSSLISKDFNNTVDKCSFPDELKLADVIPVFKKILEMTKTTTDNKYPAKYL